MVREQLKSPTVQTGEPEAKHLAFKGKGHPEHQVQCTPPAAKYFDF